MAAFIGGLRNSVLRRGRAVERRVNRIDAGFEPLSATESANRDLPAAAEGAPAPTRIAPGKDRRAG